MYLDRKGYDTAVDILLLIISTKPWITLEFSAPSCLTSKAQRFEQEQHRFLKFHSHPFRFSFLIPTKISILRGYYQINFNPQASAYIYLFRIAFGHNKLRLGGANKVFLFLPAKCLIKCLNEFSSVVANFRFKLMQRFYSVWVPLCTLQPLVGLLLFLLGQCF